MFTFARGADLLNIDTGDIGWGMHPKEVKKLARNFPEEFPAYRARVRRLVPFIF